jgi:hypothetical protein
MDIENKEFLLFLKCAQDNYLRYLLVGGYAVNYFGFHRHTDDMDIWIAPTNENKNAFLKTLKCMRYSQDEIMEIENEDFTTYFICSLGIRPDVIDVITILHKNVSFDAAEKGVIKHSIHDNLNVNLIPYEFLKEVKLRSSRQKDLYDIARLEELRTKK